MHIYLHVPFCARRCTYCDFAIAVRPATPDDAFVAAIAAEWSRRSREESWPIAVPIRTIYFGGGTPSRLAPESIERLLDVVTAGIPRDPALEVTLEANPDDVTIAAAGAWAAAGVNRVSLGVQSHDPAVLAWMHRTHRAEQVPGAIDALRSAGIDNISVDLIFALPVEVPRDWEMDLRRSLALGPSHVSIYGLTAEPHTPLARWMDRGTATLAADERYADEFLLAHRLLAEAGFEHYEVSNAALPGRRSRHNAAYWSGAEYIGLGPSAHSHVGGRRQWNVREWAAYQRRIANSMSTVDSVEAIDGAPRELERLYLGLRTDRGVAEAAVPADLAEEWDVAGWAVHADRRVRLTPEGWLRLDALVARAANS